MNFIDIKRQYNCYKEEIDEAVLQVMASGQFILGRQVEALEEALCRFTGARYAVGVSSGTDGLLLSLMALGVGPGKVVVTTPFSFFATVETIMLLGAEPSFSDIDPLTFNLDPTLLEKRLDKLQSAGKKVEGVIAVSLYGQCADMDEINRICTSRGLFLVEDACQSLGATYKGRMSGNLSKIGVTSFFPSKPLGCFGDGGMIFTSDKTLFERLKAMRVHGDTGRYEHRYLGLNARLDALQAAVLGVKLKHFKKEIALRQQAAKRYQQLLFELEQRGAIKLPFVAPGCTSVYAQYTIRIKSRDRQRVAELLERQSVPTAIHYPRPLHLLEPLKRFGFKQGDFPEAELAAHEVLSLPMHAFIDTSEQEQVAEALLKAFE